MIQVTLLKKLAGYIPHLLLILATGYGLYSLYSFGYNIGKIETSVANLKEKTEFSERLIAAQLEVNRLKARNSELSASTTLEIAEAYAKAEAEYLRGLKDAEGKTQTVIDSLRAANNRLSISVKTRKPDNCSDSTSGGTTTPYGDYEVTRGELSEEASRFLIGEANRADAIVKQLVACQSVAKELHERVNEYAKKINAINGN